MVYKGCVLFVLRTLLSLCVSRTATSSATLFSRCIVNPPHVSQETVGRRSHSGKNPISSTTGFVKEVISRHFSPEERELPTFLNKKADIIFI